MEDQLLWNFKQTCKKLNKTPWGLRHLTRNRAIEIIRIGRKIYFDPSSVRAFIEKNRIPAIEKSKDR